MSNVLVNETSLQNIASAIRAKNGSSDTYTPSEMSTAISNIPTGGSTISPTSISFKGQSTIQQLDLSSLDTSNMEDMTEMFLNCTGLTSLDVSNFDTSNIITMKDMFFGCSSLTSLDLSNFNTTSVNDISEMVMLCSNLAFLDVRTFEFSSITTASDVFGTLWFGGLPANCEVIVKDATEKTWVNTNYDWLTNVKTVAEYES